MELLCARGYANGMEHNDNLFKGSKALVELGVAIKWMETLNSLPGHDIGNIQTVTNDPPDIHCTFNGKHYSVEIIELVKSKVLAKSRRHIKDPSNCAVSFDEKQYSKDDFLNKLLEIIEKKTLKYGHRKARIDALLIASDELWLEPEKVSAWLQKISLPENTVFNHIYLMLSYCANSRQHPVYRIL